MLGKLRAKSDRFQDDDSGSATIESLLWIPMFVFVLVLITDVSFILFGKAQALRFIQDGNRALSVGALESVEETEEFILANMAGFSSTATVETSIVDGIIISTTLVMPAVDLMVIGTMPIFEDTLISVSANHFLEQ
ncbi:hypothetical protein SAMN04488005_0732 [Yoonia tamlensis]|uniref:TadE-like protein n=1 Tax=Yoonia tamlensis TaxID=390270 RepID=A0A1I6FYF0_9RHOB|nr:hypothetical protein [Yoonia tamlensis]SFR34931.1 hypothetical protein SAMN04488005_0732 [Yoonia tamlensis]